MTELKPPEIDEPSLLWTERDAPKVSRNDWVRYLHNGVQMEAKVERVDDGLAHLDNDHNVQLEEINEVL